MYHIKTTVYDAHHHLPASNPVMGLVTEGLMDPSTGKPPARGKAKWREVQYVDGQWTLPDGFQPGCVAPQGLTVTKWIPHVSEALFDLLEPTEDPSVWTVKRDGTALKYPPMVLLRTIEAHTPEQIGIGSDMSPEEFEEVRSGVRNAISLLMQRLSQVYSKLPEPDKAKTTFGILVQSEDGSGQIAGTVSELPNLMMDIARLLGCVTPTAEEAVKFFLANHGIKAAPEDQ